MQNLGLLTTPELARHLGDLVAAENEVTADIIACLVQFDERRGHLDLGYPTLHVMCLERFGFSPDVAYKRISAARAASRWPVLIELVRAGKLGVSTIVAIAPHLDDFPELIDAAQGKTSRQVEAMIAERKPDRRWPRNECRVQPVGPGVYKLEVVLTEQQLEKLEAARGLSRHRNPDGNVAEILEAALDALVTQLEKQKFAVTDRPQRSINREDAGGVRESVRHVAKETVAAEVRRTVYLRDQRRCSFVGVDGRRCNSVAFLEIDHIVPLAQGSDSSAKSLRLLCGPHNRAEARRVLGDSRVEAGRSIDHEMRERGRRERLLSDVESGLRNLGFSPAQARAATGRAGSDHPEATSVEQLIRPALALLAPIK